MPGAHLLLVEDDNVLRELILRNLQARGHDVCIAADAHTALAQVQAVSFDLVILDINLPEQIGWEMLREVLHEGTLHPQERDGKKLPVVVLSVVKVSPGGWRNFIRSRISPSHSCWTPSCSWLRRPRSAGFVAPRPGRKTPNILTRTLF